MYRDRAPSPSACCTTNELHQKKEENDGPIQIRIGNRRRSPNNPRHRYSFFSPTFPTTKFLTTFLDCGTQIIFKNVFCMSLPPRPYPIVDARPGGNVLHPCPRDIGDAFHVPSQLVAVCERAVDDAREIVAGRLRASHFVTKQQRILYPLGHGCRGGAGRGPGEGKIKQLNMATPQ